MKYYKDQEVCIKGDEVVFVGNSFIYEVSVFTYYENYFSLVNSTLYESPIFINNIIRSFFINKYTEICCDLYQAPLSYLIENGYEQKTTINKRELKQVTRKTTRTRVKKL